MSHHPLPLAACNSLHIEPDGTRQRSPRWGRRWLAAGGLWCAGLFLHGCAHTSPAAPPDAAGSAAAAAANRPVPLQADLLTGRQWVVKRVAAAVGQGGSGVDAFSSTGPNVTLQFDGKGRVHGTGPCNRFSATYDLTPQRLSIGAIASTRRGCLDGSMPLEQALFRSLESVVTFVVSPDGELTLVTREAADRGETAGVVAR